MSHVEAEYLEVGVPLLSIAAARAAHLGLVAISSNLFETKIRMCKTSADLP